MMLRLLNSIQICITLRLDLQIDKLYFGMLIVETKLEISKHYLELCVVLNLIERVHSCMLEMILGN